MTFAIFHPFFKIQVSIWFHFLLSEELPLTPLECWSWSLSIFVNSLWLLFVKNVFTVWFLFDSFPPILYFCYICSSVCIFFLWLFKKIFLFIISLQECISDCLCIAFFMFLFAQFLLSFFYFFIVFIILKTFLIFISSNISPTLCPLTPQWCICQTAWGPVVLMLHWCSSYYLVFLFFTFYVRVCCFIFRFTKFSFALYNPIFDPIMYFLISVIFHLRLGVVSFSYLPCLSFSCSCFLLSPSL